MENKHVNKARSKDNGIVFYSNTFPSIIYQVPTPVGLKIWQLPYYFITFHLDYQVDILLIFLLCPLLIISFKISPFNFLQQKRDID